ncbi:MAG TPA: RNA polymerase sigma factor [Acidimicrobiia bacterium]|nr:RNA polymerase sigma factor [Acidimicrobiia bacterium]
MSPRTVVAINTDAEQRFNELFDRHHADVYRYCLRRLSSNDAEDSAAEVFAIAWRRLDQIPDNEMARAWLLAAAYRVVGNQYRGRARRGRLSARLTGLPSEYPESADVPIIRREEEEAVHGALNSLRETDRELLRLVSWDGLSHREIGAVLGLKEDTVSKRVSRAQSRLRAKFEVLYPGSPSSRSSEAPT